MRKNGTLVFSRTGSLWAAIAFYVVCGLLLLLLPNLALSIANYALSIGLCAIGAVFVISYVRMAALDAIKSMSLAIGLVAILIGVLLLFNPSILQAALPFLWGLTLLVGGFGKVQIAFDLKRIGDTKWWLTLIGSALSFIMGILAVSRPEFIASVFTQFIGIALLVEAALDVVAELTTGKLIRDYRKTHIEV